MSRNQSRATTSVSLFPFLAVLICAMGALIFLLLVTTQKIRANAIERAQQTAPVAEDVEPVVVEVDDPFAETPDEPVVDDETIDSLPAVPEPIDPNIALQEEIDSALSERDVRQRELDAQQADLQAASRELTDAEAHLRETEGKRNEQRQNRLQKQQSDAARRKQLGIEEKELAASVANGARRLRKVQEQKKQASSKFTFVPFDGDTGTIRRPILIECTANGLRFLPEDILLSPSEMEGFTPGYNPLLAGARELVKYWSAEGRKLTPEGPTELKPYILLVVRPEGEIAYYMAREFLAELGQAYGYELLEAGSKLDLPDADSRAVGVCRDAVDRMLEQRKTLTDSLATARDVNNRGIRYRLGPAGMERNDHDAESFGNERQRLQGGSRSRNGGRGGTSEQSGRPNGQSGFERQRGDSRIARNGTGRQQTSVGNRQGFERGQQGGFNGLPSNRSEAYARGQQGIAGQRQNSAAYPGDIASGGQRQNLRTVPSQRVDGMQRDAGDGRDSGAGRSKVAGQQGEQNSQTRIAQREGAGETNKQSTSGTRRETDDDRWQSNTSDDEPIIPGATRAPRIWEFDDRRSGGAGTPGGSSRGRSGPSSRSSASSASSNGSQSGSQSGAQSGSGSSQNAYPKFGSSRRRQSNSATGGEFVSKRRWGQSNARATLGLERELKIVVSENQLLVGREQKVVSINQGTSRAEFFEEVVNAIDQEAHTWRRPPTNFYWVPSIRFFVSPRGNQHYERINSHLKKLGLATSVKQHTVAVQPKPNRR